MRNPSRFTTLSVAFVALASGLALAACGSAAKSSGTGSKAFASFLHFSECMRSNGVPNFPDPSPGGGIHIDTGSGLNPQAPAFQQAQDVCRKDLPGGGPPRVVPESQKIALINHAACIRSHGVPNYPDPTFPAGGGIELFLGSGINPSSPAFQRAAKACGGA